MNRNVSLFILAVSLLCVELSAQPPQEPGKDKDWARKSEAIPLQAEGHWVDGRWANADVGPFLGGSIRLKDQHTLKGIAIRVGDQQQASVCFDTARLRMSAGWENGFLKLGARRYGLIDPPAANGEQFFSTKPLAGWANDGRFTIEPHEIGSHVIGKPSKGETHLPRDWANYRGLYPVGQRVVLSYTVGSVGVLESPWYITAPVKGQDDDAKAFVRSFEIEPSEEPMQLLVCSTDSKFVSSGPVGEYAEQDGHRTVTIPPHEGTIRFKLLILNKATDENSILSLHLKTGPPEALSTMIESDTGRFPDTLTTIGETLPSGGPYVIDTVTLPFENPWNALFFTAGHDFFSNGVAAVCTAHGDVWTVSGVDRDLKELKWQRFATGLFQPLGLKIVDDQVYVIGRDQITRLHDRNQDGEADYHENFNNGQAITAGAHNYLTCLETDPDGNFYYIHAFTGVMRVSPDGNTIESIADGFRNPNGMGVSPTGIITAAPQQGTWTPESSLIVVKPGGYYGFGGPRVTDDRPTGWDLPMCFIPREMDNSGGGQVWVDSEKWGPLNGQMLHLSFGQCRMLLAVPESVGESVQGGSTRFMTTPVDCESGIMRGRFSPHDGQLYVSGLRGWQTLAVRDGCFQRVRYTGGEVHLPIAVKTYKNGIALSFTEPLDEEMASNPDNFSAQQWNYRWTKNYGSPEFSVRNPEKTGRDDVDIISATLMDEGRTVFLEMPGRTAVNQLQISWLLASEKRETFRGSFAHTINVSPTELMPEAKIKRREVKPILTAAEEARLRPGVRFAIHQPTMHVSESGRGVSDSRVNRLLTFRHDGSGPVSPFLAAEPFQLEASGTIKTAMSGFYDFRITGSGQANLWINDEQILNLDDASVTAIPVLLHKGHNRVRLLYSPENRNQSLVHVEWKGFDFGWEPIPAEVLFHDGEEPELVKGQSRRLGRKLFADHQCARCHQVDSSDLAMAEMAFTPPNLINANQRWNEPWLREWIRSPQSMHKDARMPSLLDDGIAGDRAATDIAVYLMSLKSNPSTKKRDVEEEGTVVMGAQLYEELGCIACHHFESPQHDDEWSRRSLHFAGAKFREGAIADFIREPGKHSLATRMPDFQLSVIEANTLEQFIRSKSKGEIGQKLSTEQNTGDIKRGKVLFTELGCARCHTVDEKAPLVAPPFALKRYRSLDGCLATAEELAAQGEKERPVGVPAPNPPHVVARYRFTNEERSALQQFVRDDVLSLQQSNAVETSHRLMESLSCAMCHDRDGTQSVRRLIIAEEGTGRSPEVLPSLTWAGEKFREEWTRDLLNGTTKRKPRPWLHARMPSFPAYADSIAKGLAAEYGIAPNEDAVPKTKPTEEERELAKIGERLTLQTGLDCRQCHAVGDIQPRGDEKTKIALGINFDLVRERMRKDAFHRFMLDPPRYDPNTRMIKLSADGITTKLKSELNGNAHQQFEAVWQYIQQFPAKTN